jgi:hypothetical protein
MHKQLTSDPLGSIGLGDIRFDIINDAVAQRSRFPCYI